MKKATPYLTQYCNLIAEWQINRINIDNADEEQKTIIQNLRTEAIKQSGLTNNELTLISLCRKYGIFKQVNVFARKLTD